MDSEHDLLPTPREEPVDTPRKVHGVTLSHVVSQQLRRGQIYVLWAVFGATLLMISLVQYSASMTLRIVLEVSPGYIANLLKGNHLVYGFAPLVFGRLADVYSRPISLALALLLFLVGCVISAASPNTTAFAVGTVFHTIGMVGISLLSTLVIGDYTSLKWRGMALSSTYLVYLISIWAGPAFFTALVWRWTYGVTSIVVFAICAPALYLLFSAVHSHKTTSPSLHTPLLTKLKNVPSRMDLVGLLIFTLGFGLTEYGCTTVLILRDYSAEYSPGRIAMLVVGLLLTFPGFVFWELYCAASPIMPGRVVRHKGVLFAIAISFLFRLAYELPSNNTGDLIPRTWNLGTIGTFYAASTIAYSACAPLLGVAYYFTRRYKPFLVLGNVLFIVGCGLWLYAVRRWDPEMNDGASASTAYLFTIQVLIGMGDIAVEMSTLIGSQASVTHGDLAIVTALVFAWTRVAGSLGTSAAIGFLLRFDSARVQSTVTLGLSLGLLLLCLILAFFVPDHILGDKQSAVNTEHQME